MQRFLLQERFQRVGQIDSPGSSKVNGRSDSNKVGSTRAEICRKSLAGHEMPAGEET
jgi:hypothetical protein